MQRSITSTSDRASNRRGFTIVELLIVIVVIAILAAITIVAYNGVQDRAKLAASVQTVSNYQRGFTLLKVDTGSLPNVNACFGPASLYPSGCSTGGQGATSQSSINNQLLTYGVADQQLQTAYYTLLYAYSFYGYAVILYDLPTNQDCGASPVLSPDSGGFWALRGAPYSIRGASTFCAIAIQ